MYSHYHGLLTAIFIFFRTVLNKMYQARVGSVWFLRSDWLAVSQGEGSLLKNVAWLRYIADPNLIR